MTIIRHKTPTEECFLSWLNNYPESFHPKDEQIFYEFAHCIFSYNVKNWLDKDYFSKKILELKPNFQIDNIDKFYNRLLILKEYNEFQKLPLISIITENDGFVQRQVINNKIREVAITEDECNNGGISKKEFVNRLNDNINN